MENMRKENTLNDDEKSKTNSKSAKCKKFWEIDRDMIPYKIHFFLYIGAAGCLLPFHPSIGITRLNLGASNLAVVFTVQQFLFIIFKPLVGYIVDYFSNLKGMIVALTSINIILSFLFLAIPQAESPSIANREQSQRSALSEETVSYCRFCYSTDDMKRTINILQKSKDLFEDNLTNCADKRNISHHAFINHCSITNADLSISINTSYKVVFKSCSQGSSKMKSKSIVTNNKTADFNSVVFITMMQNRTLPLYMIICPQIKGFSKFKYMNFTTEYILTSCYAIPTDKIAILESTLTIVSEPPIETFCNYPEQKQEDFHSHKVNHVDSFRTYQFWLFTLLMITSCLCTSCIFTLSDTACHERAQEIGSEYGKQRAWGSIGWGLMAPFAGFLNDYTGGYMASMMLMTIMNALQIWNLYKMDLKKPHLSQNIMKDIKTVLSSYEFLAFEAGVLMNGMGIGIVWFYLAWFITDIGGSRLLIGLAHTVQCFGELPCMFFSGWLIKRIGHFNVVSLAIFCHFIRFLSYSFLKNPWLILLVEFLDGITFGSFYSAMTSFGKISAKPGTEATTQSLLCSTYEGLGAGLGCVISGVCFDYYGGYRTFFYASLCFAFATVINIAFTSSLRYRRGILEISKEKAYEVRY